MEYASIIPWAAAMMISALLAVMDPVRIVAWCICALLSVSLVVSEMRIADLEAQIRNLQIVTIQDTP